MILFQKIRHLDHRPGMTQETENNIGLEIVNILPIRLKTRRTRIEKFDFKPQSLDCIRNTGKNVRIGPGSASDTKRIFENLIGLFIEYFFQDLFRIYFTRAKT